LPEQLIGEPIEMLVPAGHRAEHVALRSEYIAAGGSLRPMSQRLDIVLVRSDHTDVPVDIALSTIKIDETRFVIATLRDATVRRRAEIAVEHEQALLSAMNRISIALLEGHPLDDTFRAIANMPAVSSTPTTQCSPFRTTTAARSSVRAVDGDGLGALEGSVIPVDDSMAAS